MREPAARPAAALLFHQTEEWVWPGGFLPWINRDVMGSDDDEFPIDRRLGFLINVGFGWGLTALAAASTSAGPATALNVSHIGNAVLHVGWGMKNRRYDPGLVSAVTALLPVGAIGIARALIEAAPDRVVFGTDWPMTDPAAEIAAIRALGLEPDEEAAILGGNLARLLGL